MKRNMLRGFAASRAASVAALICLVSALACSHKQTVADKALAPSSSPQYDHQAWRAEQPKPGTPHDFTGPVPAKVVLANGLTVFVIERHELPIVAVQVIVRSGSASDVKGHEGIAQMVANMLESGTATRSAEQIDEIIETLGTQITTSADLDGSQAYVQVLHENLPQAFDVMADIVQHPSFPTDELERMRTQMITTLIQERDSSSRLASRTLLQVLYGDHPYGRSAAVTPEAIAKIKRDELKTFHAKHYRPGNAAVVVVGDITGDEAIKLATTAFGRWKGTALPVAIGPVTARKPGIVLVPRTGAAQAQIFAGEVGVPRSSPDYYPLVLANMILGGQFNSRINMNLREDKGFTYGASSAFSYGRGPGPFLVVTSTRPEVAAPAIHEMILEVRKIREGGVTDAEIASAKSNYIESLPGEFDTVRMLARMAGNIYMYDLPLDYFQTVTAHVREVTAEQVNKAIRDHIDDDKLEIIVVGDEQQLKAQLEALGSSDISRSVEIRTPPNSGKPEEKSKSAPIPGAPAR